MRYNKKIDVGLPECASKGVHETFQIAAAYMADKVIDRAIKPSAMEKILSPSLMEGKKKQKFGKKDNKWAH